MAIKLPLFQSNAVLVDGKGKPSLLFHRWWQEVVKRVEDSFNSLEDIVLDIQAAQDAADTATAAAAAAQGAADDAQAAADSAGTVSKLSGSGCAGISISATDAGTDATINISAHTRVYADGSSVSVNSGSLTGLLYSTLYYLYYDDGGFAGGAVTYQSTTNQALSAQTGVRHFVGQITTPAAAAPDNDGVYPTIPGHGQFPPP